MPRTLTLTRPLTPYGMKGWIFRIACQPEIKTLALANEYSTELNRMYPHDQNRPLILVVKALYPLAVKGRGTRSALRSKIRELWSPKTPGSCGLYCTVVVVNGSIRLDNSRPDAAFALVLPLVPDDKEANFNGLPPGWHVFHRGLPRRVSGRALILCFSRTRMKRAACTSTTRKR